MTVWEPREIVDIVGEKRDPSRCGIIPCPVNTENMFFFSEICKISKCNNLKIKTNLSN